MWATCNPIEGVIRLQPTSACAIRGFVYRETKQSHTHPMNKLITELFTFFTQCVMQKINVWCCPKKLVDLLCNTLLRNTRQTSPIDRIPWWVKALCLDAHSGTLMPACLRQTVRAGGTASCARTAVTPQCLAGAYNYGSGCTHLSQTIAL